MTQEDKELLLKDLCARLPYGVKMNHVADKSIYPSTLIGVAKDMITLQGEDGYSTANVEEYKPYLFPLSSMTEEQKREYENTTIKDGVLTVWTTCTYDWLNENHFDYRRLIEKRLALDATGLNIY